MRACEQQRRSAFSTKTPNRARRLVFVVLHALRAARDADLAAPAADISRIGATLRALRRFRMIVPSPERRHIDLDLHGATRTPPGGFAYRRLRKFLSGGCFTHDDAPR